MSTIKARLVLAVALLAVVVSFAAPSAVHAQSNSSGDAPSDTAPAPRTGGPANQPGTNTGGAGENGNTATPGNGVDAGGTATPGTPTAGSGVVTAVTALVLLALGVAAFVVSRQKRLRDLGIG
jgi:hypothetical protein